MAQGVDISSAVLDEQTMDGGVITFFDPLTYVSAGIATDKACDFIRDKRFAEAYEHTVKVANPTPFAGIHHEWRVFTCIWAAVIGSTLEGDFVECGVNKGFMTNAILKYLDFDSLGKKFYLLDTFCGIPEEMAHQDELETVKFHNADYSECFENAKNLFSTYKNTVLVRGIIPDTLSQVTSEKIAYLSIDLNIAAPEMAAIEYFWPRMSKGAMVVIDDYGWRSQANQRKAWNAWAAAHGAFLYPTPLGTALVIKS
ncbi:MAG: TylF/MycF family methyltransferase [Alphaproteobacteria bacterium]